VKIINNKDITKSASTKRLLFYLLIGILITGIAFGVLVRFGVFTKGNYFRQLFKPQMLHNNW